MRIVTAAVLATLVLASLAHADPAAIVAAKRDLQQAVNRAEVKAILAARAKFAALSAAEPDAALPHYWTAFATWRAVPLLGAEDNARGKSLVDDAMAHAQRAIAITPAFADAFAVLGGLEGLAIQYDSAAMMTLGPQSQVHLARAAGLAPANPRVLLLDAIGTLHTPAAFGGGPKPALEKLRRAVAALEADSVADSTAPDWGRDDVLLWTGRTEEQLGAWDEAREHYRKALAANPENGWVKRTLLPGLDERRAKAEAAEKAKAAEKGAR